MRFVDKNSPLRIAIVIGVLILAGWTAGMYMCRCGDRVDTGETLVKISAEKLKAHVQTLAGDIGERNVFLPDRLHLAAEYIAGAWREQGYEVARHSYEVNGQPCDNLEVSRPGKDKPSEIILVGAHYDSVMGCPGANDNASGVAALLELSGVFSQLNPGRTVRFVAFVNEEPPFFETDKMGSRVYAKMARVRRDDIRAMISLETMGYFRDTRGSQQYPPLFRFFYPDRGNFIAFVSDLRSRGLLRRAVASFRASSDFPVECVATFSFVPGVSWSDHGSFWREGYRAVMVTDTAPYRYPEYHTEGDSPDRVNYGALARVTEGLFGVVNSLARAGAE